MYPYSVDRGQGFYFVIKVKELVSVYEYPEPLMLTVDLNLQGGKEKEKAVRKNMRKMINEANCDNAKQL